MLGENLSFKDAHAMKAVLVALAVLGSCVFPLIASAQQQGTDAAMPRIDTVRVERPAASSAACDPAVTEKSVDPEMVVCPDGRFVADMPLAVPEGAIDPGVVVDPTTDRSDSVKVGRTTQKPGAEQPLDVPRALPETRSEKEMPRQ